MKKSEDYYVNPKKMAAIEGIFRNLDKLIQHARAIHYDYAIMTDGNGHFGEPIGHPKLWAQNPLYLWQVIALSMSLNFELCGAKLYVGFLSIMAQVLPHSSLRCR